MFPVRRIAPLAITATLAAAALVPASGTAAPVSSACKAGAISTTTAADGSTSTFVCDRNGELLKTAATPAPLEQTRASGRNPDGGATVNAANAKTKVRCAIAGSKKSGRAGTTLVVIVRSVNAKTKKTVQRESTPFICGSDNEWRQVSSPFAGVTLIPSSTIITRTQRV